ncbi:hypothetical protein SAMN04488012_103135 [Palleronia salina]|uniref:Ketoreductase domain-containing protein n=1 Tax=Palleronia salina TaxID=313368 RepID=A0A1M6EL84_9RHOB|nr:SDR family oxidoreductase [Palleronia salina]SHI86204.1 hypothetical protein SAMN04488012_103135 [Palleronia salina]
MSDLALVTGASSGIGAALAREHAARGGDLIVTARRADALDQLKSNLESRYGVTVHVMACDLGAEGGAQDLVRRIEDAGLAPDILVNNAGFGGRGKHLDRPAEDEQGMIDLNVKALVALTRALAPGMVARGRGRILNVGSTAGFMPGPEQAVYFATKAFVNSYTQALAHELRGTGVTATVLVPGYVETEFAQRSDLTGTRLTQSGMTAGAVAKIGYDAMRRGDLVAFDRTSLSLACQWVIPFLPRRTVMSMMERMQRKAG